LDRQQALQLAAGEVLRDAILWLALGAVGVVPAVYLVRRRVWRPLAELEAGLARVAEGDLTTGVPVRGSDELARLAQHFNEMTRVLRDRAEEQGRFAAAGELLAGVAHESTTRSWPSRRTRRTASPIPPLPSRNAPRCSRSSVRRVAPPSCCVACCGSCGSRTRRSRAST